ncbi:Protein of unknown function DUF1666 [Dillenia turbinata]|uniref:Ribosomal protein L34Ae n=1 Tax=Dillenia turbinata TaxID=194707 RepID=A0AAN8V4F0_9MAGN
MVSVNGFLSRIMSPFAGFFWCSVSTILVFLFWFIAKYIFRLQRDGNIQKGNIDNFAILPKEEKVNGADSIGAEQEFELESMYSKDLVEDEIEGEAEPKFCFKFQFQKYDDTIKGFGTSTSKYQFLSDKDFSVFLEKPEVRSLSVEGWNFGLNSEAESVSEDLHEISASGFSKEEVQGLSVSQSNSNSNDWISLEKEKLQYNMEGEYVSQDLPEIFASGFCKEEISVKEYLPNQNENEVSDEVQFVSEKNFFILDFDSESRAYSVNSDGLDTNGYEFLSDSDFGGSSDPDYTTDIDEEDNDLLEELQNREETQLQNSNPLKSKVLSETDFDEEFQKTEETHFENSNPRKSEATSDKDFYEIPKDLDEKTKLEKSSDLDSEDTNELEVLWEHQDLIEQLKMELKKVRATGLPTILEESESPKIVEDLKPWKIDEKFQREGRMGELYKFYKSYRERMRKFDILNYQKMYAIGFLQLKDPLQSIPRRKHSNPAFTSIFSPAFWPCKRKKLESEPMVKFISDLQSDLETVYVGQLCLSWEILHWQYDKALELWESDQHGLCRYNEVAGEFQQFQVLMQRFIENEPFQGPRVQNYVKNRCVLRNLLQVPVIRDDNMKDKRKARRRGKGNDAITSDMLVENMEESIRIFWRFVRADKDANHVMKGLRGIQLELQDPADSDLLMEIRTNLQKKEKKLKDLLRTGNCILRKFKHNEDSSDQVLYFFSQVDLKLVSRVLNMSRLTTDQLMWCRNKLSRINFVHKKIYVEPSFLLFPC